MCLNGGFLCEPRERLSSLERFLVRQSVDLLAGRGNDWNRVLMTIPLKESIRVTCLGDGALKSMVLQMDFES